MDVVTLVRIQPTTYHEYSPSQLEKQPNVSHFFSYRIYVPIIHIQRIKIGPQWRVGIYIGFYSLSIISYHEPLASDVFTYFMDCHLKKLFSYCYKEKSRFLKNNEKLFRMHQLCFILILIQINVHQKFKWLFICKIYTNQLPDAFIDV